MSLTVNTPAKSLLLSTRVRVKAELEITVTTWDSLIDELLRQASAAVDTYCNRIFARQKYTEVGGAYGGTYLTLKYAPVVSLVSTTLDGNALTDVTVENVNQGLLYRENGFGWTTIRYSGLSALGGWMAQGIPIPNEEQPDWTNVYFGGFITPSENLLSVATVSAAATDNSFNDSASGFPSMLKAGDIIETSGFTAGANNSRHVVSGTPTTAKIIVSSASTLVLEAAAAGRTVLVQTLPSDVEAGVIATCKSYFAQRAVDSNIASRTAGPISISMKSNMAAPVGIPPTAIGLLKPWIRRV